MPTGATRRAEQPRDRVLVDLALQGGGSHGAFTWGVLDRLLEEPRLRIEGISGTSAGAMNAVVLVDGYLQGGPEGARTALEEVLGTSPGLPASAHSGAVPSTCCSAAGRSTCPHVPHHGHHGAGILALRAQSGGNQSASRDPRCSIDFEWLSQSSIRLFVTATNVHTGRGAYSGTRKSRPMCCSPRPVCPDVPGGRDRRRALLGRRLFRQSDHHAACPRVHGERHPPGADQPGRTPRLAPNGP